MEWEKFQRLEKIVQRADRLSDEIEQARAAKNDYRSQKMSLCLQPMNREDDTEFVFYLSDEHKEAFYDWIIPLLENEHEALSKEFDEA